VQEIFRVVELENVAFRPLLSNALKTTTGILNRSLTRLEALTLAERTRPHVDGVLKNGRKKGIALLDLLGTLRRF
jgi:hypothetical protein